MKKVIDLGKIGITLAGEYNDKATYEKLTIVLYKGKSYISTKTTQGVSPEEDILIWQLVAEAKDAYHMLVDAGKTTLTEKEFLEQLEDATKGRYIIQGNVINAADEEDLTVEHSDLLGINTLKLANRDNTDGMGYVILRKNKLITEQIIKENTIYEIKYDFDLNGTEITIPKGCILNFKGGSFSNGTINGEFNIVANSTIFKNIDGCIKTNIAYSYYFGTTSSDINKGLNLFECNEFKIIGDIEFNETITINKPISITWENGKLNVNDNDKIVFIIYPIIKNVAMGTSTILYKNVERENPFIRLYGAGERGCDSFTKYELPTIKNDANLYLTTLNGLGVELLTTEENQYLYNTSIQIFCMKLNTALKITVEEGSTNITDNTFNIVSWNCTNGIVFDNTITVNLDYNIINLMFQSSPNVEKVIKLKYPEKNHQCLSIFNISLWDAHLISHTNLIDKFEKATYNNNIKTLDRFCTFYTNKFGVNRYNKTYNKELLDSSLPCISDIQVIIYCILKDISNEDSREDIVKKIIYNIITQFDYNITIFLPYNILVVPSIITSILDKVIYNHNTSIVNTANLKITISGYTHYNSIDFEINGVNFIFHTLYTFEYPDNITNYNEINITNTKNKYIGLRSDSAPIYATYDTAFLDTSIYKDSFYENHKFAVDTVIDELGRNEIQYKYLQTCDLSTTKSHNRFVQGYMFFNTDKNKLMIHKGDGVWSDALGNDKDTKGTTSQRPVLTSINEGFEYYDTTLKKKILWNGTEWTNIDGTILE